MLGIKGPLHARTTASGIDAWLGEEPQATLWPEDYFVRLGPPAELIGATGEVLAREGEILSFAGCMRGSVKWLQAGSDQTPPSWSDTGAHPILVTIPGAVQSASRLVRNVVGAGRHVPSIR